jgi:hypothetical protein
VGDNSPQARDIGGHHRKAGRQYSKILSGDQ